MTGYGDLHARYYDLIYAEKPYDDEAGFVDDRIRVQRGGKRGRLLDVACGTGRHCRAFAALGWEVAGVDRNGALLDRARAEAAAAGVTVDFVEQDMRELALADRFDAVTCLFDSIGYPLETDAIRQTLQAIRRHLPPDGVVAIEFLNALTLVRHADPLRVRRWTTPTGSTLVRVSETRLDYPAQTMEVSYTLLDLRGDGTYGEWEELQRNRFFGTEEMRLLLEATGFDVRQIEPSYDPAGAADDEPWHLLAVAVPAESANERQSR